MRRARSLFVTVWLAGSPWALAAQEPAPEPPPATAPAPPPAAEPAPPAPAPASDAAPPPAVTEQPPAPVGECPPAPAAGPPGLPNPALPADTEITIDKGTQVAAGIGFGGPIGAAASFRFLHGLGADVRTHDDRVKAVCALPIPHCAQGFTFQADAGTGGGKLSLGVGARAHVETDGFHGTAGVGLRLSLAHTWGHPIGTEPGLTYLGPELDLSVIRANLTLGVLWRVAGQGGSSALFSWGLGFGL